ncbi:MAG: GTP 3',8-cyclase MoaA [Desulfovibrio sp.]|nr:MAG: GTP 3',8-cyclase MoaA [Desulfovibrio sp.]
MTPPPITDDLGRTVNYMRLSVTDRCNLRCSYCRVGGGPVLPHKDIMRYEEMVELAKLAQSLNIAKLRLTGGEPFARPGFPKLLEMLAQSCPGLDVRITTNGTLLKGMPRLLMELGITRINISLDSLNPDTFKDITGHDLFHTVRAAVDECLEHGLKVKLNVVALKGVNDSELPAFLDLAMAQPLDLRFIEFMPMGQSQRQDEQYWSSDQIVASAGKLVDLTPIDRKSADSGPAQLFSLTGPQGPGKGRLGVISPLSHHFCSTCNRLRITSSGRLRTCLFSDREYRLLPLLRSPQHGPETVLRVIRLATQKKPLGYQLLRDKIGPRVCAKAMSAIGG